MPQIEVSCPHCGKLLSVKLAIIDNPTSDITEYFESLNGSFYVFDGEIICACGYFVMPTLIVSAHKEEADGGR